MSAPYLYFFFDFSCFLLGEPLFHIFKRKPETSKGDLIWCLLLAVAFGVIRGLFR